MPGLTGLQLAAALQADAQLRSVPAILLTSDVRLPDLLQLNTMGFQAFLAKPIRRTPLLNAALRTIGQKDVTNLPMRLPEPDAPDSSLVGPLRILLVEDLEDNRNLVALFLKDLPYILETAEHGLQGVEKFKLGHYDLVLMDIQMPEMDGYEATAAIRRWETDAQRVPTPIVALTANAFQEEFDKSLAAGCTAHLTKPIKKRTLLEAIHQYGILRSRKDAA